MIDIQNNRTILVTGGAGFIGSALIRYLIDESKHTIVNIDKLTYSGDTSSLGSCSNDARYHFAQLDICNRQGVERIFRQYKPDAVVHLAAESHVDRSIDAPVDFIQTNIIGTYTLLEISRSYWDSLRDNRKNGFRFLHVSTDEVYGSLAPEAPPFDERTRYEPNSPYSASKASSDHLVRAWHKTYGLPTIITNCSNNFGPYQFPEKLIPLMILNAIEGKSLPVYGNGDQVRDWLYVEDHVRALALVLAKGRPGETYNIGARNEVTNLALVETLCCILDELKPDHPRGIGQYSELIRFVEDRPGHDARYAIDPAKIQSELNWKPLKPFTVRIRETVQWYLDNLPWSKRVQGSYARQRLGLGVTAAPQRIEARP